MQHEHAELYECDICGTRYREAALAERCESAGRPPARFGKGDPVLITDGDYARQFEGEPFPILSSDIFLDRPGLQVYEDGQPGEHMVIYVIQGAGGGPRITFVPQHHLSPAKEDAHA